MDKEAIAFITLLISTFKDKIVSFATDIKDEISNFMDDGLSSYIESQQKKYLKTKTFGSNNELVDFYKTYYPLTLQSKSRKFIINDIEELFEEKNCVALIGIAGSGKTMITKYCFLKCLETQYRIPIVVELRNLNNSTQNFTDFLKVVITNNKLALSDKILERILDSGFFLFILDGYDEIFSQKKTNLTDEIDFFIDRYHKNNFLITSRPNAGAESFPRFINLNVLPLTLPQITEFINQQLNSDDDDKFLASKIIETIQKNENQSYIQYLDSPLLLSMFILTFNSYPELPNNRAKFYWNVFDTLSTKHNTVTKRQAFQHEKRSGLTKDELEKVLKWFSYISLFKGEFTFTSEYFNKTLNQIKEKLKMTYETELVIYDLTVSLSIVILDGIDYKLPHKSFQEYFATVLISEQSEEDKIEIYTNQIDSHIKYLPGGNDSFWGLCTELDRIFFYKYYVLKTLKEYLSFILNGNYTEKYMGFYAYHNRSEKIIKHLEHYRVLGASYNNYIYISLLNFLGISSDQIFDIFYNEGINGEVIQQKFDEAIEEMINTKSFLTVTKKNGFLEYQYSIISQQNNVKYQDFLKLTDIEMNFSEFIQDIENAIKTLELEIQTEEKNKKSLLFFN